MNTFLVFIILLLSITVAFLMIQARDHYKQKQTQGGVQKDEVVDISKLLLKATHQTQPLLKFEDAVLAQLKLKHLLSSHNNSLYELAEYLNIEHEKIHNLKTGVDELKESVQKELMNHINQSTDHEFNYDINELAKISD